MRKEILNVEHSSSDHHYEIFIWKLLLIGKFKKVHYTVKNFVLGWINVWCCNSCNQKMVKSRSSILISGWSIAANVERRFHYLMDAIISAQLPPLPLPHKCFTNIQYLRIQRMKQTLPKRMCFEAFIYVYFARNFWT